MKSVYKIGVSTCKEHIVYKMPYIKSVSCNSVSAFYLAQAGILFIGSSLSDYARGAFSYERLEQLYAEYISNAPFLAGQRIRDPAMAGIKEGSYIFASRKEKQTIVNFVLQIHQDEGLVRVYSGVYVYCCKGENRGIYLLQSIPNKPSKDYGTSSQDPNNLLKTLTPRFSTSSLCCKALSFDPCLISIEKILTIIGNIRYVMQQVEANCIDICEAKKKIRCIVKPLVVFADCPCIAIYPDVNFVISSCFPKNYNKLVSFVGKVKTSKGPHFLAFSLKPIFTKEGPFILLEYQLESLDFFDSRC